MNWFKELNWFKEWLSDPVRVFDSLSTFMAGVLTGALLSGWLK
jgi:chloramphenicol 3-O-phosphotransferase